MKTAASLAMLGLMLSTAAGAAAQPPATTDAYREQGREELARKLAERPVEGKARNILIFIGDGLGVSTLTAARIHQGQRNGLDGECYVPAMRSEEHTSEVQSSIGISNAVF